MTGVARLLWTYFTGVPLLRWIATAAIVLSGPVLYVFIAQPRWLFSPYEDGIPLWITLPALLAMLTVVYGPLFSAALMPVMFARFATGRQIYVLPYGRVTILVSVFAVVATVSVFPAFVVSASFFGLPGLPMSPAEIFVLAYVVSFFTNSVMYVILWLVSRSKSPIGLLAAVMLIIVNLATPSAFIAREATSFVPLLVTALVIWSAGAAIFLFAPQLKNFRERSGTRSTGRSGGWARVRYVGGREVDLLVGTARPWLLAIGQLVPIAIATLMIAPPNVWLFFLTIFSTISGAITSTAATRSRTLWLRSALSRQELFARVEAAFWRHNSYALGVLLVAFVALGSYLEFSTTMLALGLVLLALANAVSTYLGLMMTRRIGWFESALAVAAMLIMMSAAIYAADGAAIYAANPANASLAIRLELMLAGIAVFCRYLAKRRWAGLDWMLCRPEPGVRQTT